MSNLFKHQSTAYTPTGSGNFQFCAMPFDWGPECWEQTEHWRFFRAFSLAFSEKNHRTMSTFFLSYLIVMNPIYIIILAKTP